MDMNISYSRAQQQAVKELLARVMMAEARGEGTEGMTAVGSVARNRVGHPWYGEDLMSVLSQPNAFAKPYEGDIPEEVLELASNLVEGSVEDPTGGAKAFHSFPDTAIPKGWGDAESYKYLKQIGGHHFYGLK